MKKSLNIATLIFCLLVFSAVVSAQIYNPFNQRDDQYRMLGLKRARQSYEVARSEFERQQELFDRKLITELELEQAKNVYTDAEVNYQQSLLAVLFEEQYITVVEAVKYQATDGRKHVRLKLANTSGGSAEFRKLVETDDELFRALQPDVVNNVYVSILNDENSIISQPYEAKIDRLKYGGPRTIDFALLQDLDAVTIFMVYSNGTQRTMKIFLQKDESVDRVLVQSEQFSQEVELGESSSFDLNLELFSGTSNTFSLEVVNLPLQIARYFNVPGTNVRLHQVKFTESTRAKGAILKVTMPDRPTDEVKMDQPIPFFVLVIPRDKAKEIKDLENRKWTEKEIQALGIGYVRLELLPRGKGELLVRAPLLFHSIEADESAETFFEIVNEGSHRIDNIEVEVDLPLRWQKEIDPQVVPTLGIREDTRINMIFTPPEDIAPGKYDIRVRTTAMSDNQPITSDDKTITVEIKTSANVMGTLLIVILLLGLVGGIVYYGIRLTKR